MADEATPAANPPEPVDLAGRKDVADLVQAYRASSQEAQRLAAENQALRAQQPAANYRPEIQQRSVDPFGELESIGVPKEYLRTAINQVVVEAFEPIARQVQGQAQARNQMLASYGKDYVKFEQEVAQHIQSDPGLQQRYNAIFQSDPVAAAEYAFLKFGETKRREHPAANGASDERDQQAQAAIPTGRSGEGRNPARAGDDAVLRAFEAYQTNPSRANAERYAKARFRTVVTDEHLGLA